MTDVFVQSNGYLVDEKISLIERKWPDDIPDVDVEVVGYPDDEVISYQVSFLVDGDEYGTPISEEVDDQMEPEEFEVVVDHFVGLFRNKYHEITEDDD